MSRLSLSEINQFAVRLRCGSTLIHPKSAENKLGCDSSTLDANKCDQYLTVPHICRSTHFSKETFRALIGLCILFLCGLVNAQDACLEFSVRPRGIYRPTLELACSAYVADISLGDNNTHCIRRDVNGNEIYEYGTTAFSVLNPHYAPSNSQEYCQIGVTGPCRPTGDFVLGEYTAIQLSCPSQIELTGPDTTKALPAGPNLSQFAKVTRNGNPYADRSVSISLTGGGSTIALSGTTDANGQVRFTYVPPRFATSAVITATCDGCGNTATKVITVTENPPICPAEPGSSEGNPINPAAAYKMQTEVDFTDAAPHGLSLSRHYRSSAGVAPANLGSAWSHNYAGRISITGDVVANISLGSGGGASFLRDTNTSPWSPDLVGASNFDRLVQSDETLIYTRASDESQWVFTNASPGVLPVVAARLISIKERNGRIMTLTYNAAGQISQVTNAFGRSLSFSYNANNQLNQVTTPDGKFIGYVFGSNGAVQSVSYPDNASKQYLYELPTFPQALTGITNEAGQRYATFSYDAQGRAVGTAHAGGVESYAITYPADAASAIPAQGSLVADGQPINPAIFRTSAQVTDPLGNVRTVRYQGGDGSVRVLGQTSPAGGSQFASRDFGLGGTLPTQEIDFLGFITQTTWDTARRLPTQVVRAATRPEAQTVQTQWHPTLRLPTLVTEVGRTMATTYDALGNKLSETITDTSTPANTARTSAWTYNAQGLVATETAPNGGITSYTYNTAGNPLVVTNPLGHATTFAYAGADGAAGRVTSMLAPTGLLTSYIYDLRGRLLTSVQSAGASTLASLYTYTLSGQLASASLPSGHEISYSYDAAQRLTGWQDNRGARGVYTLDAMGNRTTEQIQNTAGQVVWQLARSINALNRVASETVGNAAGTVNSNLQTSYGYNANASLVSEANALAQATQYGLDGLRRVTQITNAANASANLGYNALDAVTTAKDFKGVATATMRDALGNATTTASPDAGLQSTQYDALGLPKQIVDALGQATQITRDLLGRPSLITQADGRSTQLRYDLAGSAYNAAGSPNASQGYLTHLCHF